MFALTADHAAVRDMAKSFADERIAPTPLESDETDHFPIDAREAATLGMTAIHVREEHGGSGMTRLDAALILEALAIGCPSVASFLSANSALQLAAATISPATASRNWRATFGCIRSSKERTRSA